MNSNIFESLINGNNGNNENYIEQFVTPLTPYFICNHFISSEINTNIGSKYICYDLKVSANNLLMNKNYCDIKNFDIIQIQVDYFNFFFDEILPDIVKRGIYIIIVTSQWHLPQIHKNHKTDACLNSDNILLWISQNPIYTNHEKYMAFPYGLLHTELNNYISFVKSCNKKKENKIINQHSGVHIHLPNDHIRRRYSLFGIDSGPKLNYFDYLNNIAQSEFVISTSGDREDCYRHYECIGLDAIPLSNINNGYIDIFQENMIYSTAEEMVNMVNNKTVEHCHFIPNKDILTIHHWVEKINARIKEIKERSILYSNMLVTIFGSCRLESIYKIPVLKVTGIRDNISYTHYTKEMLEVIKFCKEGHVSPEETVTTFRTPILHNRKLYFNHILSRNFNNTQIFILEIASRKTYEYNVKFVHHILFDSNEYNKNYKDQIKVSIQSDEEVEDDIIKIKKELNRPMIIVGHILAYNNGPRNDLVCLLEKICLKHDILFINPKKEIESLGYNVKNLLENDLTHYNNTGHLVMQSIYVNFIKKLIGY